MYTFDSRIRYSEVDHRGQLTLPGLINYFQDCSTFQSEHLGVGFSDLKKRGCAWILSYWQIVVNRLPKFGEEVTTGTFATGFKGLYGNRDFVMKDRDGAFLAGAHSVWVFMDMLKGRPVKPEEADVLPYETEAPLDIEYEDRKIKLPEMSEGLSAFPVRKYHIDTNEHVNNGQYVQMAMECLPDDLSVRQLRVAYKKSAVCGDMIYPKVAFEPERTVAELCDEAGRPYAVVEFR